MYEFPLQKVLDYRLQTEEKEQAYLAQVQREAEKARLAFKTVEEDLKISQQKYAALQKELQMGETLQAYEYLSLLAERLQVYEHEMLKQEERLQQQVKQTEKAMQERKIMDKLREKDYSRYHLQITQAEQRQTDEIARTLYLRQKANS
ncbi:MAG: hypothetical protein GX922_05750 [Firmicutes bacterium]|nr:hypothetical protein [Bacillota bacterium]